MKKFEVATDEELSAIIGGSNDGFWTGFGYYAHIAYNTRRKYPGGTTLIWPR